MSRRSDSVCTSFGLLLTLADYPSSQAFWILFTDQKPTLALGLLFVLPVLYLIADVLTLPVFGIKVIKSLQMDLYVSCLVRPVTEYSAIQGSSRFPDEHWPGVNIARLLLALEQGTRSLKDYIQEYLSIANYSDLPDCLLIVFFAKASINC